MRYTRYIVALAALILAAACINSDIDDTPIKVAGSKGQLQVVGRISQFADCNVATRSKKDGDEPKVTSMGLALFPIENGQIGNCLYYDYQLGGSIVFIVDRHDAVFKDYTDKQFAMYIFANMQDAEGFPTAAEDGKGKSLAYFKTCAVAVTENIENVPENGFPMMGSLGDNISTMDKDGGTLILKPTSGGSNPDGLPVANGSPTDNLEIPLKAMYAKFSFTITVKADQEIVGNKTPRFDNIKYWINNLPSTVDTDSDTAPAGVIATSYSTEPGNFAQGASVATFDFYIPERYLSPNTTIDNVLPDALKKKTYDTTVDADQNGYRDEDEKYHQRFKPLLVDDKDATYLTIEGYYTDHQVNTYKVSYDIYLGGNSTDNFDIKRNTHYINSVTIRGISSSDDQSLNEDRISIDHRVTVEERSIPLIINFRREALLDAHYEVRPLRLRLVGSDATATTATVQILNEDGTTNNIPSWIRLEASGNTSDHITSGVSAGKRKYFTTDLVTNTLAGGTNITVNNLSTTANQTLWVYVDENLTKQSRAAIVRITYGGESDDFKVVQNGLFEVKSTDGKRTYYIEQHEEYLYNYDAEDNYGQTKDEGMPWGLNGVQLSKEHNSFYIDENNTDWNNYVNNNSLLKYDFYIAKYDSFVSDGVTVHGFAGQHFTSEIVENSNGSVKKLTMDEQPSGAVEYCYNRNKRNSDGSIAKVEWYLPSADELEDFIVPAYSSFEEFQDNYYWTSQPAYIRNAFYYEFATGRSKGNNVSDAYAFVSYEDNKNYARATKVVAKGNDVFEYVKSGLNQIPNDADNMDSCINANGEQLMGNSYFDVMYAWYRWKGGTDPNTIWKEDTHYNEKKNSSETGVRYHVDLGHSFDKMYQVDEKGEHGYHARTKYNRVRCVRKNWNPDKNFEAEIVYTVSTEPATTLDKSGSTKYVIRNAAFSTTALTTSDNNVAASSLAVGFDNYVVIEGNKIKSVANGQYFSGYDDSVSFNDSGTSYTVNKSGSGFTISHTESFLMWSTTYYLKQTSDTAVSMSSGNNGNLTWNFYEVKKEYKVVE